jgi:hypothetical protein
MSLFTDGRDHRKCCTRFPDFPEVCLPYCQGLPGSRDLTSALCLVYLGPIFTCFTEGQGKMQNHKTNSGDQSEILVLWSWAIINSEFLHPPPTSIAHLFEFRMIWAWGYTTWLWTPCSKLLILFLLLQEMKNFRC